MTTRTTALYLVDDTLRRHTTKVVSIEPALALSESDRNLFKQATEKDHVVTTQETVFYAQGGGQPYDTGVMTSESDISFVVNAVRNGSDGRILHLGSFEPRDGADQLKAGDTVHQVIDGPRRELNSRVSP